MTHLIDPNDKIPKASTEIFYGLGMPISGTLKGLDRAAFAKDWIFPVRYDSIDLISKAKNWCRTHWVNPNDINNHDDPRNKMFPILAKKCATATWIHSLLDLELTYPDEGLKGGFYIPNQREFTGRDSWTMGAAALIARAENSDRPGLKGCVLDQHGLEVLGVFNGSSDGMEYDFVAPVIQPAFDDESYDEVFTADAQLIKSSDVPSSAKFIHSLSDNNIISVQVSLSFANLAFFAVILVAVGAWVYRRALRRASSNISLPGDIVKF